MDGIFLELPADEPAAGATFIGDSARHVAVLAMLLRDRGWQGSLQDVREAMPPGEDALTRRQLADSLARLGYRLRPLHRLSAGRRADAALLARVATRRGISGPLLLLDADGAGAAVLRSGSLGWIAWPAPARSLPLTATAPGGTVCAVEPLAAARLAPNGSWLTAQIRSSLGLLAPALILTAGANLAALASPLFTMAVYDRVIAAGAVGSLPYLIAGALGAAGFEMATRSMRSRIMSHVGLRLGYGVGNAVFGRLLDLPLPATERLNVSAQVARVKDIDRVRELFGGTLEQTLMDLPFALLFLVAIALLGGWLAVVPAAAVLLFAVLAPLGNAVQRHRAAVAARAGAERQTALLEMAERMRAIRAGGHDDLWLNRVRRTAAASARAGEAHARAAQAMSTVAHGLTSAAGLATLVWGVHLVLAGSLTTGGLIASMMLVWRLLGPVQQAFVSSTRLGQIHASVRQIDGLMRSAGEREIAPAALPLPVERGEVSFQRVTFRYGRESDPTLGNLNFATEPGDVVAVLGRNGGGKSTVLKLVSGLYTAQGGAVSIDGRDIRQYAPAELRRAVVYMPQVPQFFHGTLLENLKLLAPDADHAQILHALEATGALEAVMGLEHGLDTRFDSVANPLPSGLSMRLSLARLYLRPAPIVLLDEPATGLDMEGEFAFIGALEHLRRRGSTVFLVTHRRQYLALASKVLVLEGGTARYFGPADKVKDRIPRGMI